MHEKCLYSEFFGSVFSQNAKEYGPESPQIRALSTHCNDTGNADL